MAGSVANGTVRLASSYRRMPVARLWQRFRLSATGFALVLAIASGGCSMPIGSLGGDDGSDRTGSINPPAASAHASAVPPRSDLPAEADLAIARATAIDILNRGGKNASAPWENPKTGARGTVTPLASAYNQGGFVCRDFLASYLRDGSESWLQGEACRMHHGRWEIRALKPWKRS